jgi:hypothetical protein
VQTDAKSGGAAGAAARVAKRVMHKKEAMMILNIEESALNKKVLDETYKRQFDKNDPKVGGSFYLQSKLFRSHQSLEVALKKQEQGIKDDDEDQSKAGAAPGPGDAGPGGSGSSSKANASA